MSKRAILVILDGWGHGRDDDSNAIFKAQPPFFNSLLKRYPFSHLRTDGENVGLPIGQMGNSEVGHMNIGAGRVVYQQLVLINKAFREKTVQDTKAILDVIAYVKNNGCKLHLIGLVSDGGVHSHINHLKGLVDICEEAGLEKVFVHAFLDGRDTDPKSGVGYMTDLLNHLNGKKTKVASVIGRYYAMDRDKRWERVKLAYDLLVNGKGERSENLIQSITKQYMEGITDEFMRPLVAVDSINHPLATIREGDAVICFNFRTDRGRQITAALTQQDFHEQNMHKLNLHYVSLTNYDRSFKNVEVVFNDDNLNETLGEVLEKNNCRQVRIAETEKYPHVTFFFSGGREVPFNGESRFLCPSPKVATYDLQPEMSADDVCAATLNVLHKKEDDFVVVNFANPDMVGHTGVFEAVTKAILKVDECLRHVVLAAAENNYSCVIIADHGNADYMVNDDGTPNTAHSLNPVWCVLATEGARLKDGILADVAPTILDLMEVKQPPAMTGKSLLVHA